MIYVAISGVKSEGRGSAGGNGWHDTDDIVEAIEAELARWRRTWDGLGHGACPTLDITVATDASPKRTTNDNKPLPVERAIPMASGMGMRR